MVEVMRKIIIFCLISFFCVVYFKPDSVFAGWVTKPYYVEFSYDSYDDLYGLGLWSSDWDDTIDSPWIVPGVQPLLGLVFFKYQINIMMTGLARHIKVNVGGNLKVTYQSEDVYSLPDRVHTFPVYFSFEPIDIEGNELEDHLGFQIGVTVAWRFAQLSDYYHLVDMYLGKWTPDGQKSITLFDLGLNINASGVPSLEDYTVDGIDSLDYATIPIPIKVPKTQKTVDLSIKIQPRAHDMMKGDSVGGAVIAPDGASGFSNGYFSLIYDNAPLEDSVIVGIPANYTNNFFPIWINDFAYETSVYKQLGMGVGILCFSKNWDPEGYGLKDELVAWYRESLLSFSIPVSAPPPLPDLKPHIGATYYASYRYPEEHCFANEVSKLAVYPQNIGDANLNLDATYSKSYRVAPVGHLYIDGIKIRDFYFEEQTVAPQNSGSPYIFTHTFTQVGYHSVKVIAANELEEMNYANNTTELIFRVFPERGKIWGKVEDLSSVTQPDYIYDISMDGKLYECKHIETTASLSMSPYPGTAYYEIKSPVDLYDIACIPPDGSNLVSDKKEVWHDNWVDECSFQLGRYGNIKGVVKRSDNNNPIQGVNVGVGTLQTVTNSKGEYSFFDLSWGQHTVTAAKPTTGGLATEYFFEEDNRSTWEKVVTIPPAGGNVTQDFYLTPDTEGPTDCSASLDGVTMPTNKNLLPFILSARDRGYPPYKVSLAVKNQPSYPLIILTFSNQLIFDITSWNLPTGNYTLLVTFYDSFNNASTPVEVALARDIDPIYIGPPTLFTLTINDGDAATNCRLVKLDIQRGEAAELPVYMQIKNESGGTWSDSMPYTATRYWSLDYATGSRTVYVRFGDAAGNFSDEIYDSIMLDTSGVVKINGDAQYTRSQNVSVEFTIQPLVDTYMWQTFALGTYTTTTLYSQAWQANNSTLSGISVYLSCEATSLSDKCFPIDVYFTDSRDNFNPDNPSTYLTKHTFTIEEISRAFYPYKGTAEEMEPYFGAWGKCEYFKVSPAINLTINQTYYLIVRATQTRPDSLMRLGTMMNWHDGRFPEEMYIWNGTQWLPTGGGMDWITCRFYTRPFSISNDGTNWSNISNDCSPINWTLTAGEGKKTIYIKYINSSDLAVQYFDQIILDSTPPTGTASIESTEPYYYSSAPCTLIHLNLNANDPGSYPSGIKDVTIKANPSWDPYIFDYAPNIDVRAYEDGSYNIVVTFEDNAGNVGEPINLPFEQHIAGPNAGIVINTGEMYTTSRNLTLHFSAVSPDTVTQLFLTCSNDYQSDWINYTNTMGFNLPDSDGPYTFDLLLKDSYENVSDSVRARIILDQAPPEISLFSINASAIYTKTRDVTLYSRCYDKTSGVVKCRASETLEGLNSVDWNDFYSEVPFTVSSGDGNKSVFFQVSDNAGLIPDTISDTIRLDENPPEGFISIAENDYVYQTRLVHLILYAYDIGSSVAEMRFRNIVPGDFSEAWSEWENYQTQKEWYIPDGLSYGKTVIVQVQYKDANDNTSTYQDSIVYTNYPVIKVAPSGPISLDPINTQETFQVTNSGGGVLSWYITTSFTTDTLTITPTNYEGDGSFTTRAIDFSTTRTGTVIIHNLINSSDTIIINITISTIYNIKFNLWLFSKVIEGINDGQDYCEIGVRLAVCNFPLFLCHAISDDKNHG
jgi:hypothetical protein